MVRAFAPIMLLVSCLFCSTALFGQTDKPNVLFIVIDDLNDWIGSMDGHPQAKTPHMDSLASRGTLFTNAHCQAPICGPSRGSFLSGLYPHQTGLYNQPRGKPGLSSDSHFFDGHLMPQYFAKHGYKTLGVGKITHGYDLKDAVQVAGSSGNSGPKPKGPKPPNDVRFHHRPDYSLPFTGTQTDWGVFPERNEEMPDFETAEWAVDQLKKKHDKPFFMAVGFHRPHVPFYAPQEWFDMHPLDEVVLTEVRDYDLNDVPETGSRIHELPRYPQLDWLRENDSDELRRCTQAYLACTSFVDAQVGKVLNALEASSHADDTIIVLFSDHGYHLGEKSRVSKHSLWEEATRVPMMIITLDSTKAQQSSKPTGLIDLYPTLIELCGLPERSANAGKSLVPLLENPDSDWRHSILTTYALGNHSLRSEQYRYIRYDDGTEELYDHKTDRNEWHNLATSEAHRNVIAAFRKQLPKSEAAYHTSVGDGPVNAWFVEHFKRHGVGE
ncbi:sulfatase [Opitutia bacterium ISCC 51]|nr:sulfatase [Opitutae bacterium ISCC 51]QXD26831.1 sulfatase [Opitutae bacterium ISCC 52]